MATPSTSRWPASIKSGRWTSRRHGRRCLRALAREGIDDGKRLQATLAQPSGIVSDQSGANLYWVDPESSSVRTVPIAGDGNIKTLVGTGLFDYGDNDGSGTSAKLQHAQAIALGNGVLYLADTYNHKIRALNLSTNTVTTLAGNGTRGWSDGTGKQALFDEPSGLSYAAGKLYVADTNNNLIRVVDVATNAVSTLTLTNLSVAAPVTAGRADPGRPASPKSVDRRRQPARPIQCAQRLPPQQPRAVEDHVVVLEPGRRRSRREEPDVVRRRAQASRCPCRSVSIPARPRSRAPLRSTTAARERTRSASSNSSRSPLPVTIASGASAGEITMSYGLPTVAQ